MCSRLTLVPERNIIRHVFGPFHYLLPMNKRIEQLGIFGMVPHPTSLVLVLLEDYRNQPPSSLSLLVGISTLNVPLVDPPISIFSNVKLLLDDMATLSKSDHLSQQLGNDIGALSSQQEALKALKSGKMAVLGGRKERLEEEGKKLIRGAGPKVSTENLVGIFIYA